MNSKTRTTLNILYSRGLYFYIIFGILTAFTDLGYTIIPVIGFMFLYVVIDIIGYESVSNKDENTIQSFRIQAATLLCALALLLWRTYSIWDGISFLILHRFGLFDYIYYKIARKLLPDQWTWLKWTPFGWLAGEKGISNRIMKLQIACGIIIVSVVYVFRYIVS